ncbi:MAG TPA: response regulator [Clostridiales bacterium]|nr:response regulator [Clostridiales bacterium]
MALYRILLVDDEEEVREGIIRKIDWESLGFEVAGDAENGLDALEKAEHLHPDVVMTDIKMPFMDGLELGEKLRVLLPSTKLIIFSGFDDFEYAKKAIKINVAEYVLKPINSGELTETLKRLKAQMDQEFAEKRDVETLRRNYLESLPVLREQFLVGLLEGRVSAERLHAQAKQFGLSLEAGNWAVAMVRAAAEPRESAVWNGEEELIPISLKRTLEEILGNYCRFVDFYYSDSIVVLAELEAAGGIAPLTAGIDEVCKSAEQVLGVHVTAGVGTPCDSPMEFRHSYREAQSALEYSTVPGAGRTVYIGDMEPAILVKPEFDEQEERALVNAVKMGSEEEIRSCMEGIFARLELAPPSLNRYQIYLLEMFSALLKIMHACGLEMEKVFSGNDNIVSVLGGLHTPEEMKRFYTESCVRISELIRRERVDSTKLLAENAKQYIAENYQREDLSVEELSSFLHVSATYFSTVFKRETGMSFVAYLTEVRLQQAVNLLNTTDDKTYVIAQKVGYPEPNYFSYVFKRKFGVSPSKYRSQK